MGILLILLHHKVILLYESEIFFWGGGAIWAYFGHLVQKIRIWALMKSNGHNINRNGLYDPLIDGIGTCYWYHWKAHQKYYLNAYIDLRVAQPTLMDVPIF